MEFTLKLYMLFEEAKKVDGTFITELLKEHDNVWPVTKANQLSINYTDTEAHLEVAVNTEFQR